jgi:hypothetical protein
VYIEIYSKTINIVFEKMELEVQIDMLKNLNAESKIYACLKKQIKQHGKDNSKLSVRIKVK